MRSPSPNSPDHRKGGGSGVVFLDRDGVINHDSPDYIKCWSEVRFIPGSLSAIKSLNQAGFSVMVITNQSAVGRKMISLETLLHIHREMGRAVREAGGRITDFFFCPHAPEAGCPCRKPLPGLILQAREKYRIDLGRSTVVGDRATDIECAKRAGCRHAVLVKTGNGAHAAAALDRMDILPDKVADNLAAAADWIIAQKIA